MPLRSYSFSPPSLPLSSSHFPHGGSLYWKVGAITVPRTDRRLASCDRLAPALRSGVGCMSKRYALWANT